MEAEACDGREQRNEALKYSWHLWASVLWASVL